MKYLPYAIGFIGMVIVVTADWWFPAQPFRGVCLGIALAFVAIIVSEVQMPRS